MSEVSAVQSANDGQRAALHDALCEVARLRSDDLPGISEIFGDNVIFNTVRHSRGALGYFGPEAWAVEGLSVSEVVVLPRAESRRPGVTLGEDVLTTLIHELAHVYAHYTGVKDTSNRGRWHNGRFGEIAHSLGLVVERTADSRGRATPGISSQYIDEYSEIIATLDDALTVSPARPRPKVAASTGMASGIGTSGTRSKYPVRPAESLTIAG